MFFSCPSTIWGARAGRASISVRPKESAIQTEDAPGIYTMSEFHPAAHTQQQQQRLAKRFALSLSLDTSRAVHTTGLSSL